MTRGALALIVVMVLVTASSAPPAAADGVETGTLPDGATYVLERPPNWNGALLLYCHGYRAPGDANPPGDAGGEIARLRPLLLGRGYALAGSSYAATGYAVADALTDGEGTLGAFTQRYGRPVRTIVWGHSLGGLIAVALAQRAPERFAGALSLCGVLAGSQATWDELLDAQYVFGILIGGRQPAFTATHIADPDANLAAAERALRAAQSSPQGRARLTLAAAFVPEPSWWTATTDPPRSDDDAAASSAMRAWFAAAALPFGFGFRAELERRAGGNPSQNAAQSYAAAWRSLPERALVERTYMRAGLDVAADLRTLDAADRVRADPAARQYLRANAAVGGALPVPVLTLHTVADGLVPVESERAYADAVPANLRASRLRQLFIERAGHCAFTAAETLAAFDALEARLRTGAWASLDPEQLDEAARAYGDAFNTFGGDGATALVPPAFVRFAPHDFLRRSEAP